MDSPSAGPTEVAVGFGNGVMREGSVAVGIGVGGGVGDTHVEVVSASMTNATIKIGIL